MRAVAFALVAAMGLGAPLTSAAAGRPAQRPDITGVWNIYPDPFAHDESTFQDLPAPNGGPKLKEPYASQWKALRAERDAKLKAGTPLVDPSTLCIPEGMPTIMGAIFPFQILQTPGQVTVLAEFLTQTRRIYLDQPMPKPDDLAPSYYGFSSGHWQGGTLFVTTRGVREDVKFFEIPHSADMTITELIRLTGPGRLEDQIVIEDPKVLAEPYRFTYGYKRNDHYRIMEYFCDRQDPLLNINKDGTVTMNTEPNKN